MIDFPLFFSMLDIILKFRITEFFYRLLLKFSFSIVILQSINEEKNQQSYKQKNLFCF